MAMFDSLASYTGSRRSDANVFRLALSSLACIKRSVNILHERPSFLACIASVQRHFSFRCISHSVSLSTGTSKHKE